MTITEAQYLKDVNKVKVLGKVFGLLLGLLCLSSSLNGQDTNSDSSYFVTFIINNIPDQTPEDATLYLAGDFDAWFPDVKHNKFAKYPDGSYRLTRKFEQKEFLYKFTRGSWKAVEGRGHGRSRPNRRYNKAEHGNTVYITIRSWEDITPTRFNSYVYILLFASLQSILMIIAIFTIRNKNVWANSFLSFQLFLMAVALIGRAATYNSEVFNLHPKMLLLPDIILFTYAPSFFLFIHHLLKIPLKYPRYWYFHFLPAIIHVILYIPYLSMNNQTFIYRLIDNELWPVFATSGSIALAYNTVYWFLAFDVVRKGAKEEKQNKEFQKYINFLKVVLRIKIGYLGIWAFAAIVYLVGEVFGFYTISITDTSLDVLWILFAALVFFLGYRVIKQPEIIRQKEEEAKYKDSILSEDEFTKVKSKLELLVNDDKIYLDPDITLPELSNKIPTSVHTLSRVINEGFDQTFSQFINEYRVKEFIQRMEMGEKHDSYLSLAFTVGFNSKATFNRSFKKYTGTTPRMYFKDVDMKES